MSEIILHEVKAYLYKNAFDTDGTSYYARPAGERTVTLEEVAASAVARGGATLTTEQLISAFRSLMAEATLQTCNGFNVNLEYFGISFKINGTSTSPNATYNSNSHKLSYVFAPYEPMRSELENTSVTFDGLAEIYPEITQVTDMSTGATDSTLTAGQAFQLTGKNLKIAGEADGIGVHLVNVDDGTDTVISGYGILINQPKTVIAMVPSSMSSGTYVAKITTQYSSSGRSLAEVRTGSFDTQLTIG